MATTDPSEKRAFASEQKRRVEEIAALAESINGYARNMIRDVNEGQYVLADGYARRAAADIVELRLAIAGLRALNDVRFVVADTPEED
ncbi:ParB N-terminal domain-containing protein [Nonomuraea typhae]|uniref:ParB N-terminal domain-containing protein n=1 Tax=Nonomuraea typhae TaxID=2603600 RepID=A0ABW7YLU1_9ACTN